MSSPPQYHHNQYVVLQEDVSLFGTSHTMLLNFDFIVAMNMTFLVLNKPFSNEYLQSRKVFYHRK